MIITQVGMAAITHNGERYTLNPSLANMAKLRGHAELVSDLLGPDSSDSCRMEAAHKILIACCDKDIYPLLVSTIESKPRIRNGEVVGYSNREYPALIPASHAICIAAQMVRHGVFGVQPKRPIISKSSDEEYSGIFEPEKMAAIAMAHLGVSQVEAWGLTMTSLLLALNEKFPPPPEAVAHQKLVDNYDNLIKRREQHKARKLARQNRK